MPSIYIVLQSQEPDFDVEVDGTAFSEQADQIVSLCEEHGLASPFEFFSVSQEEFAEFAADFDDLAEDEDIEIDRDAIAEPDDETWFAASLGLDWIADLRTAIEDSPGALSDEQSVLDDLTEYERVLTAAEAVDMGWHFGIDY